MEKAEDRFSEHKTSDAPDSEPWHEEDEGWNAIIPGKFAHPARAKRPHGGCIKNFRPGNKTGRTGRARYACQSGSCKDGHKPENVCRASKRD